MCIMLQVPLVELRSDARDNMLGALLIAGEYVIPEVAMVTVGCRLVGIVLNCRS